MNITQYLRQEKAISAADKGGIRERWMWGLRLLRDPKAFAPGSSQLRPGRADEFVRGYKAKSIKLSQREIQYRLRAARTYETESQIAQISARFENWSSLIAADFPAVDALPGELPADHRDEAERHRDAKRALARSFGEQATLFPASDFEAAVTPLKTLAEYADEMEEWTGRQAERDRQRREYLNQLLDASGGDLSVMWQDAHRRAFGEDVTA